ncbi:DUF5641 domain-containing protein [Trichonephila clavipes]|nr:DUF5641 domain-containing protein [Trichonephila clavipes]
MLHEFRLINVRSENNETISFVYGAKVFDPIGMLAPSTLLPKLLLQEIWKMKIAWDQELPQNIVNKFMKWFNEIQILKNVTVPRCMKIDIFTELHVFVDASKGSYAGCVFARSIVDSRVSVILVRAKSRVAPLKLLSIPRLEIMACCVGARLVNSIFKALNMPDLKVTLWSDSTTALWWIKEYGNCGIDPSYSSNVLIENRCSDTTDIDELNSRDLRKRMKYRIKLLSDLRQRYRKEYLSELIQKQNDNRVREPRIGEMVLIGNDNKKRLSWSIAKIIELIPGRDREIRTVRLKTQHGTVIRPVQRIFPLEVQAIANSDEELKEESISVKSTKPEKVLNTNDAIVKKYTSSGRLVKEPKRLDLLNYTCYRFETLP